MQRSFISYSDRFLNSGTNRSDNAYRLAATGKNGEFLTKLNQPFGAKMRLSLKEVLREVISFLILLFFLDRRIAKF
jgi:hypothetical protein